jgi:general secretion pathway protein G
MRERDVVKCARHPGRPAVARCTVCGEPVCGECARVIDGSYYCARDEPSAGAESAPRPEGGRLRPALLLVVAAAVGISWGVLASLRPKVEAGAAWYRGVLTRQRLAEVAEAAAAFKRDVGRYPTEKEGLPALVVEPGDGAKWFGPYLRESYVEGGAVVDVAGRPLKYRVSDEGRVIIAVGEDGEEGTADDVEFFLEESSRPRAEVPVPDLQGFFAYGGRRGVK